LPEYCNRFRGLGTYEVIAESDLSGGNKGVVTIDSGLSAEAALLYTSGTTGKPKGCMLSNEYFLALGIWYNGLGGICSLDENDRLLTPLPPNHMNALCTSFPAMMLCGGCVIQIDRFHPRSWWQTVRDEKATVIHCLGVMTAILLTLPEEDQEDFSSQIKFCFGPGSDPRHQGVFEKRFGVALIEAWAMTESGAGGMTIAYSEPRHVGQRCIGRPIDSMDYRIIDDNDVDVSVGKPGELLVRAKGDEPRKGFFSGYYKDPDATEQGWRGGWWHTGDVVRAGDDGSLYFVDRRKNVIRRSGENIAAVEVEATLLQHAAVVGCAVCAVPDEIRGDEVFAFVILDGAKKEADAREIFDHCMAHLTYFKVPGYIAFVPSLPLTASQKVSRGEIRKMARDTLAANKCVDLRDLKRRTKK
jgi:acyl-coenzyme A synthetase/AMP-(fatty) acid ligase